MPAPPLDIQKLRPAEAEWCARTMSESEPWLTLKRGYAESLRLVCDQNREVYLARRDGEPVAFLVLSMRGVFVGYVQTICVAASSRGKGIGTRLLAFAEERIFRESPNVFLCVSSFNQGARRLYENLGYQRIGEMPDYMVRGHAEILYRKTLGPWSEFTPAPR